MTPTEPGWDEATGSVATELIEAPLIEAPAPAGPARRRPYRESPDQPEKKGAGADREDREEERRHLRLVENQARRRAGRRRLLVVLGIASVAVVCLSLVALHVLIAENQFRLDDLQQQAATEQASYEKLRLQVAELEAPARIVSQAEGRLGMVQPASVTYLPAISSAPSVKPRGAAKGKTGGRAAVGASRLRAGGTEAQTSTSASGDPPTTGTVTAPQGDSDWPTIKPYLSGSP